MVKSKFSKKLRKEVYKRSGQIFYLYPKPPEKPQKLKNQHFIAWINFSDTKRKEYADLDKKTLFEEFLALSVNEAEEWAAKSNNKKKEEGIFQTAAELRHHNNFIELRNAIQLSELEKMESKFKVIPFLSETQISRLADALIERFSKSISDLEREKLLEIISNFKECILPRGKNVWQKIGHDDWFKWPSTDIFDSYSRSYLKAINWEKTGPLKLIGYEVGLSSRLSVHKRKELLRICFESNLKVLPNDVRKKWGEASSAARLKKIADSLAAFSRNAKRKTEANYVQAIKDWQTDLDFLYQEYYCGFFDFGWPKV